MLLTLSFQFSIIAIRQCCALKSFLKLHCYFGRISREKNWYLIMYNLSKHFWEVWNDTGGPIVAFQVAIILLKSISTSFIVAGNCEKIIASLKSLVTIRMNEIFLCLACYGQKLNFLVRKSRQRLTQALRKEATKIKFENFWKKLYLRLVLTSSCLQSLTNN